MVGAARCAVPARIITGGTDVVGRPLAVVSFRRLTLRSATRTAQRTVPTWMGELTHRHITVAAI